MQDFNNMLDQIERRDAELASYREDLEAMIMARTAQLAAANRTLSKAVKDLETAKEQAEASNRAKSQFLANMSHEIRTPMNGVLGIIELLERSELSVKQRRYLQMIRNSGNQLLTLICDILDLSKIEAGQVKLETRPFNLRQLLEETLEVFAPAAQAKGLDLNLFLPAAINVDVVGDSVRLGQIVTNLVGNAIKFTTAGSVLVRVTSQSIGPERAILRFDVLDSGIGIAKDRQDQIFEAFVQADGSTTRKYGGTGLGLSISKQFCELMGGQIGVVSEPGKGTIFWFTMPVAIAAQASAAPLPKLINPRPVLLVADNSINREILTDHLVSWGLSVEHVATPFAAEQFADAAARNGQPYAYAVIDLVRGTDEAYLLAYRLTDANLETGLRAVVISSYSQAKDLADGPVRSLVKPLNRSDLYSCLACLAADQSRTRDSAVTEAIGLQDKLSFAAHILLVEDNAVNQEVAIDLLEEFGCAVDGVANGLEAINHLRDNHYDIVLMDCQMPEMDGYAATRVLREYERPHGRHTPVIALTANAMEDDRALCLAAGMDDYMTKPVTRRQLGVMLDKWTRAAANVGQEPSFWVKTLPLSPTIDSGALQALADGAGDPARGVQLVGRVVAKYLETSPELVRALRTGNQDRDGLARSAHTLKSSSAYVGALQLSQLCKELEQRARAGDSSNLNDCIDRIEAVFGEVCVALRALKEYAA